MVSHIPQKYGLYHVDDIDEAHARGFTGIRVFTLDELHQKLGHISLTVVEWLVEQKTMTGLELDLKAESTFCPVCAKAKLTWKAVPKERYHWLLGTRYIQMYGDWLSHKATIVKHTMSASQMTV